MNYDLHMNLLTRLSWSFGLAQGFSHPLPAGKKMPAEPPKNARQALKENVFCQFCVLTIVRNASAGHEMPAAP